MIIDGIEVNRNEKVSDVEEQVKKVLVNDYKVNENELKLEFDKAHRIGQIKRGKQPVIVRFKSHSYRASIYSNRKRHQNNNNKLKLRVCLTSQRRKLLNLMNEKLENSEKMDFCFANINGDLKVRLKENFEIAGKKVVNVKSESDIDIILHKLDGGLATLDDQERQFESSDDENLSSHSFELFQ